VRKAFRVTSAVMVVLATAALVAQDAPAPPQAPRTTGLVSLKVSLVLSRYQGEKKITSVPYTLLVTANQAERTSLRMGNQIPVPTTSIGAGGERSTSYQYRDVGTNIDCSASSVPDGQFRLTLTVTDSSVYYPDRTDPTAASTTPTTGSPAFRNFNSTFNILLRDGQTAQYTSATDQVSGQVIKLDATINIQK
jgi:Bacterial type II and III secretion system protein